MRRLGPLVAALALGLGPVAPAAGQEAEVSAIDDVFRPDTIRIPVGGTVTWSNDGRNPHTVTADDEAWDSGNLDPDASFSRTFEEEGVVPYFCRYHGAPGGLGMAGTILVGDVEGPGEDQGPPQPPLGEGETIRVPRDHASIQGAVDAAAPGDLVLISPGIYRESVRVTTPFLTIRGTDRSEVVLDGEFSRENGIHVLEADGVTIENMTARSFTLNGFYWTGVRGYRGSYLTAFKNGDYGIYAFDSVYGQFDHSYASGSPDAGFYIGQCRPCHAVITDVVAEGNALGYSGTNAGGELYIVNSEWRDNMSGIVPNTLDSQLLAPQGEVVIAGNRIHDNNNRQAPAKRLQYPTFGTGIVLAGGTDNLVVRNRIEGHERYGIAAVPNLDANLWFTEGNEIRDNVVRGSGEADLALGGPAGGGDCFQGNEHATSLPPAIETFAGCGARLTGAAGDLGVTFSLLGRFAQALSGDFPRGDYRTGPPPGTRR